MHDTRQRRQYDFSQYKTFKLHEVKKISKTKKAAKIECPYCDTVFETSYPLSSSGKKCPTCGAVHNQDTQVYAVKA